MDYIDPRIGLPVAAALWVAYLLPNIAAWNRARRAARKANR